MGYFMRLKGKKAIVTGAAAGLGKSMAMELAQEGADIAVWDINRDAVQRVQQEIESLGSKAMGITADVSDTDMVNTAVKEVVSNWGQIDILINNAGICKMESIENTTAADWDRVMAVNLKGTFLCSQAVMAVMKRQGKGKIVNLGSIAGKVGGIASGAHYSASKAGVMCFTKSLARELAPFGINVNGIAPGIIETEMTHGLSGGSWDDYLVSIPLGRIGQAYDVARVVVFLASSDADYLTGEIIDVNGGQLMD